MATAWSTVSAVSSTVTLTPRAPAELMASETAVAAASSGRSAVMKRSVLAEREVEGFHRAANALDGLRQGRAAARSAFLDQARQSPACV